MKSYSLSHLADHVLLRDLAALVSQDRATTAEMLAHLAEVDGRRLYARTEYPSLYAYCVGRLRMSEDMAAKRIHAARAARKVPAIFAMLADGRLTLSAVWLLAPKLTPQTAAALLPAAAHKTNDEIKLLLAERFPQPDMPALVQAVVPPSTPGSPAAGAAHAHRGQHAVRHAAPAMALASPEPMVPLSPPPAKVAPLAPERFGVQFTFRKEAHEKLRHAQALLGLAVPSGDLAEVFERALDELIARLERQKFAATSRPRPGARRRKDARGREPNERHVPAAVRRAVWRRDGGRCTFVGDSGRRCEACTRLETLWNDGLAVVTSSCLREEKPTAVARGHLDRGLAPAAPEPHTRGARREHERYHLRRDGRTQEGDQRGDASAGEERVDRVAAGQRAGCDSAPGEEAAARSAR